MNNALILAGNYFDLNTFRNIVPEQTTLFFYDNINYDKINSYENIYLIKHNSDFLKDKIAANIKILDYPTAIDFNKLPFNIEQIPVYFSNFYKILKTEIIFPLQPPEIQNNHYTFYPKTPQNEVYYNLKILKKHPKDLLNEIFFIKKDPNPYLKEILLRDWLILKQLYSEINTESSLYKFNQRLYEAFISASTGFDFIDACIIALQEEGVIPLTHLKALINFYFKVLHLPPEPLAEFLKQTKYYEPFWENGLVLYYSELLEPPKKKHFNFDYLHLLKKLDPGKSFVKKYLKRRKTSSSIVNIKERIKKFNDKYFTYRNNYS